MSFEGCRRKFDVDGYVRNATTASRAVSVLRVTKRNPGLKG
jgi:hypothetical protein